MWYNSTGKDSDVVLSTRVRLARNLAGYPFPGRMTDAQRREVSDKVKSVFTGDGWEKVEFASLTPAERASMLEKHLVSREFVTDAGARTLIKNEEKSVYIMTPEEDHLRIQSVVAGLDIDSAVKAAFDAEETADKALDFAFSEQYGYVTHCPTNLGTGMRLSVMMFLPAYTEADAMFDLSNQLSRLGMTVRGMHGEGSGAAAYLYQISNQTTLGVSEEEIAKKLGKIVGEIIENERKLRKNLPESRKKALAETARRDYGILMYAGYLSSHELVKMYAEMRYASVLGLSGVPVSKLDEMLIRSLPNTVAAENNAADDADARDKARAETARKIIA